MTTIPRPDGASASSIWTHLTGQGKQNGDYPGDAGDFGRCEAFLDANPDLRAQLPRMAEVNAYWAGLVPLWEEIRRAPDQRKTVIIHAVVKPLEKVDPTCGRLLGGTIRSGPITFKGEAAEPPAEPDQGMLQRAVNLVWAENNASTSFLQRRLGIGYNAAARLIERMEELAIVSKPNHVGKREVRTPEDLKATLDFKALITTIVGEDQAAGVIAAIVGDLRKQQEQEKPMPAGTGHNSADPYAVTADELRQFIERYEQLEAEKKDVTESQKELMAEAKGRGYDTKVMRKVIALRKRKPDELAEEEAVLEVYKAALGMS